VACETDFVARNELFMELVGTTASSVLNFRKEVVEQNLKVSSNADHQNITHLREVVMAHDMMSLSHPDLGGDITLEEHLVQLVGKIGENLKLKRGLALSTAIENIIGVSTHGNNAVTQNGCHVGSFAGVVVIKPLAESPSSSSSTDLVKLARDLSQHVIGMNPEALNEGNGVGKEESFLGQEFLLDDKVTVGELVRNANVEIVDFVRLGLSN
jgi:Translation elongation factor Ts